MADRRDQSVKPHIRLHFSPIPCAGYGPRGWWASCNGMRTLMYDNAAAPIRAAGRPGGFFLRDDR